VEFLSPTRGVHTRSLVHGIVLLLLLMFLLVVLLLVLLCRYNSDFAGCGLGIWITGSRVIHTTSRGSVVGPYTPTGEVAVAGEAHNPQAVRTPDGTYLLMDSYNGPDAGCATKIDYDTCKPVGCTAGFHGGNCR